MRRGSLVLGTLLLGACATAGGPPAVPREAPPPLPGSLRWVLSSAEYRALFHQTYRAAAERFLAGAPAVPVARADGASAQPLFSGHEPLQLTLRADWRAILRHRADTDRTWPAGLRYRGADGDVRSIPVRLSTRGISRLDRAVCSFPLLFLHFKPEDVAGTLFAQQTILPLVTYCKRIPAYQQYVIQEYLLYRVYNLLTEWSLDVRLGRMAYEPTGAGRAMTGNAFFVENYHALAERFGGQVIEEKPFHPEDADPLAMSLLEVFQYFIGNTDWSVVFQHNVVLMREADGTVRPVPYDLDAAGALDASYAVPHETLGIDSVRERVFRGFCRPREHFTPVFERFIARRGDIEALYRVQEELGERERERTLDYYERFYGLIDDTEGRKALLDECREVGFEPRVSR